MTSYAKVKWNIIEKWNSDAKYSNSYLIDLASDIGVEIRNERADRKSIVAKVSDGVIKSDIEKGDCTITEWGTFSQEQTSFEDGVGNEVSHTCIGGIRRTNSKQHRKQTQLRHRAVSEHQLGVCFA